MQVRPTTGPVPVVRPHVRRLLAIAAGIGAIGVAAAMAAACGGGDSSGGAACDATPATFASTLACIPDTAGARQELYLTRAHPLDFYLDLTNARMPPLTVLGVGFNYGSHSNNDLLTAQGLEWDDFAFFADGGIPPNRFSVARGRFNAAQLEQKVATCSNCPVAAERTDYGGSHYFTWGDPLKVNVSARLAPPFFDELGRGGAMSFNDRYILRGSSTDLIKGMIDVAKGKAGLGKDPDYTAIVRQADSHKLDQIFITNQVQGPAGPNALPDLGSSADAAALGSAWNPPDSVTVLLPYTILAVGQGEDSMGSYGLVILVHPSTSAASENASRLEKRIAQGKSAISTRTWASLFTSVEAKADGKLTVATLRGPGAHSLVSVLVARDPLFLFR